MVILYRENRLIYYSNLIASTGFLVAAFHDWKLIVRMVSTKIMSAPETNNHQSRVILLAKLSSHLFKAIQDKIQLISMPSIIHLTIPTLSNISI